MVWKAANLTPASAVALTEIIPRQDIPPGLFNLVVGPGQTVGQRLVEHRGIDAISFTGLVSAGPGIAAAAANMTKVQMEIGSKNPMLIMDDADLDLAVIHAAGATFRAAGQKCTAASQLILHAGVHDAFVEKLVRVANAFKDGPALTEGTQIGPVASANQLAQNLAHVDKGRAEGATLLCGGTRLDRETEVYFMAPTIFAGTRNDMAINREEMFPPIPCVIQVDSNGAALAVVNDSEFGPTAGIMTCSLARANRGPTRPSSTRRSRPPMWRQGCPNDAPHRRSAICQLVAKDLPPDAAGRR